MTSLARPFVGTAAMIAAASPAWGQETGRHYRLGVVTQTEQSLAVVRSVVVPELARLGFVEGGNLSITYDTGGTDELTGVAAKVVAQAPDAILAIATPAAQAARAATGRIPIVRFGGQDAVTEGFAETLARPIGNLTGVVILGAELDAKRLEVLHEAVPGARRMAALVFRPYALRQEVERQLRDRASRMGVELLVLDAAGTQDYPGAFAAMKEARVQALLIGAQARFAGNAPTLLSMAFEAGLPTACDWAFMARQGCMLGYGPAREAAYRRVAGQLARVLSGTSPAEIPVEQPTEFEFAINLRTARSLGVEVPPSVLVRADEVIE